MKGKTNSLSLQVDKTVFRVMKVAAKVTGLQDGNVCHQEIVQ